VKARMPKETERRPLMRVIARFTGPHGEIAVLERLSNGMRVYREGGVEQSCVLAGGESEVAYVRLMAALLLHGRNALLLGCGGGALAGMLHRRGLVATVVDSNPVSFELARTFFWMPEEIECINGDMGAFVRMESRRFDAIGVDVGGPSFSYADVLQPTTVTHIRGRLQEGGRVAINISCEARDDPTPGRIAERFARRGLEVWAFKDDPLTTNQMNAVILASARREEARVLAAIAAPHWALAQLA
jgi:spermidine synthase